MLLSNFSSKTYRISQFLFTFFVILGDHPLNLFLFLLIMQVKEQKHVYVLCCYCCCCCCYVKADQLQTIPRKSSVEKWIGCTQIMGLK